MTGGVYTATALAGAKDEERVRRCSLSTQLASSMAIDHNRRRAAVATQTGVPTGDLLERDRSVERLVSALVRARAGERGIVVVEGEAGIGKTALLGVPVTLPPATRLSPLAVPSSNVNSPTASHASSTSRTCEPPKPGAVTLFLSGAAELAAPVLGLAPTVESPPAGLAADPNFAANHGLCWLTANVAERRPLLVLVDDAHSEVNHRWGMITALYRIGFAALALGDGAEARERFGEALERARASQAISLELLALSGIGACLAEDPAEQERAAVILTFRDGSRAAPPSYAFAARPALDRLEAELPQEELTAAREAAAATTLEELERTARQSV
jgi:hypothetical protein